MASELPTTFLRAHAIKIGTTELINTVHVSQEKQLQNDNTQRSDSAAAGEWHSTGPEALPGRLVWDSGAHPKDAARRGPKYVSVKLRALALTTTAKGGNDSGTQQPVSG